MNFSKLLLLLMLAIPVQAALTADQILEKADEVRFPSGSASVRTVVVSKKPGRSTDESAEYDVWVKGRDRTLIRVLSPASDRGTAILMAEGGLWIFLKNVSKPLRVSLQQRLIGEVSNGDLARTNFVGDYTPVIIEKQPAFYVLSLKAKRDDVTYGSIKLWVQRTTFKPLKAAFYAVSGRILKVGSYEGYKMMHGHEHPSRIVFTDAVTKGKVSTITYDDITPRTDLADKYFTKDYLKKLKY